MTTLKRLVTLVFINDTKDTNRVVKTANSPNGTAIYR